MSDLVETILGSLNSSVELKNEEDKGKKFAVRINVDWSTRDFNVDIPSQLKLNDNSQKQSQSGEGVAKYTDSVKKNIDPNLMEKFVKRMQNLKLNDDSPVSKQADNRTPPSVKIFFDESKSKNYPKKENADENSITQPILVDTSDDDDVVMVDDKQLDEIKNIRTRSKTKEERDKNHAGKFKDKNKTRR